MTTILRDNRIEKAATARVEDGHLWIADGEYRRILGAAPPENAPGRDGHIDVSACWQEHQRPVLHDDAGDVWVLGTSARERADALTSLEAPDFTLPDLDGTPHSLSECRGRKVFLASWSSW